MLVNRIGITPKYNYKNNQQQPSFGSMATMSHSIINGGKKGFAKAIEFSSFNMPFAILITAMLGGVLVPRLIQAQSEYDKEEILRRDLISEATIVFGANAINNAFSKNNEKKSGFVLTTKPENFEKETGLKKLINYLKPKDCKGVRILSSEEIVSKYSQLDNYKKGLAGFCEFIDSKKGDLKKLFSFDENTKKAIQKLCPGKYEELTNETIIDSIKKAGKENEHVKNIIEAFSDTNNIFVRKAKAMNSRFNFLSMMLIVPLFLGICIPKMNESITKKKYKEREAAKLAQQGSQPQPASVQDANATSTATVAAKDQSYQPYKNPNFMSFQKNLKDDKSEVFKKIENN